MTDGPDRTKEESLREAAALLGPGSVGEVVRNFKKCLKERDFLGASLLVDEDLSRLDLSRLDLGFLDKPGWGVSGRPRVVGPDAEIVLYIRTGEDGAQRVDKTKPVQTFPFTVRRLPEGMRISQIGQGDWLMKRIG